MVVHSRGRVVAAAVAAVSLMFVVTGCGGEDASADGTPEQPTPIATSSGSPTVPPSPTEPPTQSQSPSQSESPSQSQPDSQAPTTSPVPSDTATAVNAGRQLEDRPLSAEEVPGFNEGFTWRVKSNSTHEGRRPFGTCHKFAMTSIGATRVAVRRYAPTRRDADSTAANLVARFADAKTAKRAYEVLKSWRSQCDEELAKYPRRHVGKLQSIELSAPSGPADWYLLVYGPARGDPDSGYFDAQGLTRVGRTVSVLTMRLVGQDYNYDAGREPMVAAVRTSAAKLSG